MKKDNIPEFTETAQTVFDVLKGMDYKITADCLSNTDESVPDSNHHLTVVVKKTIRISIATDGRIFITFPSIIRQDLTKILKIILPDFDTDSIRCLISDNTKCQKWISKDEAHSFKKFFLCIYLLV